MTIWEDYGIFTIRRTKMVNILFVCLGDTCRSPMACAIMEHKLKINGFRDKAVVSSAGISVNLGDCTTLVALEALR